MTFAEKLKELRHVAGLTQQQLAEMSGRGLGAIRDYEQGNREPLYSTVVHLTRALGVSVEVFAECVEESKQSTKQPSSAKLPRPRGRPPKVGPSVAEQQTEKPTEKPKPKATSRRRKGGKS